jgi:hypothetical protein
MPGVAERVLDRQRLLVPRRGGGEVLMHPDDRVPNAMVDALYYVDELANDQGMDRLMDEAAASILGPSRRQPMWRFRRG